MPAVTALLLAVFRLLRVKMVTIIAFQKQKKRDIIINHFNKSDDKTTILIIIYAVKAYGLNLQQ